jgi:type II secretory pathway component PulF
MNPGRPALRLQRIRIAPADRVLLFRQLQMLLASGILLADALRSLRDRFPDLRTRQVMALVYAEVVQSRRRFSAALSQFPRSFPAADIAILAAGESGGSAELAERLGDLAERVGYEQSHRHQIRRACAYPCAVMVLASGLLAFLVNVVVPRLEELLRSLGGRLPPLASALLASSRCARGALPWIAASATLAALVAGVAPRWPRLRIRRDQWLLRLPVVGPLYRDFSAALFCKIYRSLYLSNQPAPAILEACANLFRNEQIRRQLRVARAGVMQHGARLSTALDATHLFPPIAILSLEVGEQSGQLAESLDRVSQYLHGRARARLDHLIACLNPVLTTVVVAGVGTIMIAFFQALYQVVYAAA